MVKIIETEMQKKMVERPSRLEVLREYEKRGALSQKYQNELWNMEAGEMGEKLVLKYLHDFGEPHWQVVRNVWLDYHTTFECDMLLLTRAGGYAIEVKYYTGEYELKNSQWSCNGMKRAHNPVGQTQKVVINIQNIARQNNLPVTLKGVLVFTGPHFTLAVQDSVEDVDILTANQLRNYIYEIKRDERNSRVKFDEEAFMNILGKYETANPFPAENLYGVLGDQIRKGVMCCHCGSFDVETNKTYVTCGCGMHEPREMAIVRTICEYSVIHFYEDITTNAIFDFCDGAFTKPTLATYLNRYFERFGNGKSTKYKRISRPFLEVYHTFGFLRDCKYVCKNLHKFDDMKRSASYYNNNSI